MKKIYALYKGEKYICDGTLYQLANFLGVKERTIRFYMTPTYEKRGRGINGNRKRVIFLYNK